MLKNQWVLGGVGFVFDVVDYLVDCLKFFGIGFRDFIFDFVFEFFFKCYDQFDGVEGISVEIVEE